MSVSPDLGQKTAPEKASFSQICSLLSWYLKEKGSFGDLTLGMTSTLKLMGIDLKNSMMHRRVIYGYGYVAGAPEVVRPTMSLFPMDQVTSGNVGGPRSLKSMDLFPQQAGFSLPDNAPKRVDPIVNSWNKCDAMEPRTAPMTIFYGGQVMVFNDLPAEKAKEIMLLATKCSSGNNSNLNPETNITSSLSGSPKESGIGVLPTSNVVPNHRNNVKSQETVQPAQQRPVAGDLPIARRASLHRFLEKRKDRITSKGPYQPSNSAVGSQPKPRNSKPWLGLAVEQLQ
ncbi:Pectin lyase-like superfamily protein isoform 1 [Hibiscus syriacus]|uniref:Protein TIFY n=1 Tax=Hibiscus syriacus TaxID=106335 RepID=A0A6A2X368_HIBSY|nr:Pectin lyase-like superfamily protein isoform 1 [Hibiscus syriacus]